MNPAPGDGMIYKAASAFWDVFTAMAPWLIAGFLIAGVLAVCIPRPLVVKVMGGSLGFRAVLRAVLIGVPLPLCSCGVIPVSALLRKAGASKGATAGFLISTPQTGIDSVLATYALLGPFFAVARPVAAFLSGLAGGCAVQALSAKDAPGPAAESLDAAASPASFSLRTVLWQGYMRILGGVVKPLSAGLAVAALVAVIVPDGFFAETLGEHEVLSLFVMAFVGFPMYICSTAAIPVAASLAAKGLSPGAVFVFLMVGPAVNAVSITTVSALIGRRAAVACVAAVLAGAVLCGAAVDCVPGALPAALVTTVSEEAGISVFRHACGVVMALLMVNALVRRPGMK